MYILVNVIQILIVIIVIYILLLLVVYAFQSRLIFKPQQLARDFKYVFKIPFESFYIDIEKEEKLHALWFKNKDSNKTIFFCHGSNSNMSEYESEIMYYTSLGFNFFIWDYRGFGKSSGSINNQRQFYRDVQLVYDYMLLNLEVGSITVMGYSIGTAAASKLASQNKVDKLILLAPYYSLVTLVNDINFKLIPNILLKYPFVTHRYLKDVDNPVYIFHGVKDKRIPVRHARQLKNHLKVTDSLFLLPQQDHYNLHLNPRFCQLFESMILEKFENRN